MGLLVPGATHRAYLENVHGGGGVAWDGGREVVLHALTG